jgi:hypothetical protein
MPLRGAKPLIRLDFPRGVGWSAVPLEGKKLRVDGHFGAIRARRRDSAPSSPVMPFTIFSQSSQRAARTKSPACRGLILSKQPRASLRDMKNPGEKIGNDVRL